MSEQQLYIKLADTIKKMDNIERNADSSLKGYFFQIHFTLNKVLCLEGNNIKVYVEKVEDVLEDALQEEGKIRIIQVKHHETKTYNSTYTEPMLYLYKSFLISKIDNVSDYFDFNLVKYDLSNEREAEEVFQSALKSGSKKNLKIKDEIQKLEQEISIEKIQLYDEFLNLCRITTSLDIENTVSSSKQYIKEMFAGEDEKLKLIDDFYGWAWVHIVDNLDKKDFYITKNLLRELFLGKVVNIKEYLENQNWKDMKNSFDNININLSDIGQNVEEIRGDIKNVRKGIATLVKEKENDENGLILIFINQIIKEIKDEIEDEEYDDELEEEGIELLSDILVASLNEIRDFILKQIENDLGKYYFLLSIVTTSIDEIDFQTNKIQHFYQCSNDIKTFIRRLTKIYFYKKYIEKSIKRIGEMFNFVGKGIWMISAKDNYNINLLGGEDSSKRNSCINSLMKKYRYNYDNNFPDLILLKGNKRGSVSDLDITKGSNQHINYAKKRIDKREREIFLKCINCLDEGDYSTVKDCTNIFKFGCEINI
ncbi:MULTISPECIES: hypothetical protein [Bacillus]|uniref:hypothetical protein n=1 Tax=Bacillus TaxID=1386 RepID=UPI0010A3EC84|nr:MULTISPECIES: hypothetical protein [Bacillus]MDA4081887.1 hypothetical protein [Bacillus cereus]QCC39253.1 hypothetical protein C3Y97_05015 [Bacillus sp. DU-106]